jgi:methylase of polypeptide subunit release factors
MDRLLLLHNIMTRLIGGLYLSPIDKAKTRRILDIGTGTGVCKQTLCPERSL